MARKGLEKMRRRRIQLSILLTKLGTIFFNKSMNKSMRELMSHSENKWKIDANSYLSCQRQMFRSGPWRVGYKRRCTFCWGAFDSLRENTIWLNENVIFKENYLRIRFCTIFSWKIQQDMKNLDRIQQKWENGSLGEQKWSKGYQKWAKGHQKWAKREPTGAKSEPKVSQREPKVSQWEPKVSQREPRVSQWEPKGSQKWAKGRPKCIKKSTFGEGREKHAKRVFASNSFWSILGAMFRQKTMNKSMRKSMPKMWGK